jgi:hypothetical protein
MCKVQKNCYTLLDMSVSSLRRGHANLLCIVPILADDLREVPIISNFLLYKGEYFNFNFYGLYTFIIIKLVEY